jgi:hypothetical protein
MHVTLIVRLPGLSTVPPSSTTADSDTTCSTCSTVPSPRTPTRTTCQEAVALASIVSDGISDNARFTATDVLYPTGCWTSEASI